jgi:lysophospholipase L1-like esterase
MNRCLRSALLPAVALALALAASAAAEPPARAAFALRDGDRVVFYGDSITQDGGYGRLVEEYVATRFPAWDVRFDNAGVGGDTVKGGGQGPIDVRLERDVIALRPSVVTIMLGMNDGGYKPFDPTTLAAFGEGYTAIVRKLQQALPGVRLTLIRSSPFDDVARPPQFQPGYDDALRRLGCYVMTLAARERATAVDFRDPLNAGVGALVKASPDLAPLLLPDRVHPSGAGHLVMGATLLRAWGASALVTRVEIDAAAKAVVAAENTDLTELSAGQGSVSWTQLDRALPLPLNFDDAEVALAQKAGADLASIDSEPLIVKGLPAGRYELRIDGSHVADLSEAELATGVDLARRPTPQRWQAMSVKWSVADSVELQRLRRRLLASGAGDATTQEVAAFLAQADEAARRQRRADARPKARRYEVRQR